MGAFEVSQSGRTIHVSGSANNVEWPEFSSIPSDLTGYYIPLKLSGKGFIGKTMKNGTWKVIDVADCSDAWVVAVDKGQKSFTFQLFSTKENAEAKTDGVTYTVDLSGVNYGE